MIVSCSLHFHSVFAVGAFLIGAAAPCLARAAEAVDPLLNTEPASAWIVTVGGTVQVSPSFDGSRKLGPGGLPSISWRRANEPADFNNPDDSFDFTLFETGGFRFGPVANYRDARLASSDRRLTGIHKIPWTLELGGFAEYWPLQDRLRMRVELRRGFHGHAGLVADLSADWVERIGKFTLSAGPRLSLGDGRFMNTVFGITAADALSNPSFKAYKPTGGIRAFGAGAAASYAWSDVWTSTLFAHYERLVGRAAKSPIVSQIGQRDQFTVGIGLTYSFRVKR